MSAFDRNDLTAVIVPARRAQIVRTTQLAAVRALLELRDRKRVVATAHPALGGRSLSLGDGHFGTLQSRIRMGTNPDAVLAAATDKVGRVSRLGGRTHREVPRL